MIVAFQEIAAYAALAFVIGLVLGKTLEARRWRASAGNFRRMESGGTLYIVREEWFPGAK